MYTYNRGLVIFVNFCYDFYVIFSFFMQYDKIVRFFIQFFFKYIRFSKNFVSPFFENTLKNRTIHTQNARLYKEKHTVYMYMALFWGYFTYNRVNKIPIGFPYMDASICLISLHHLNVLLLASIESFI